MLERLSHIVLLAGVAASAAFGSACAETLPSAEVLDRLLNQRQEMTEQGSDGPGRQVKQTPPEVNLPAPVPAAASQPSRVELDYRHRLGSAMSQSEMLPDSVKQIGYEAFANRQSITPIETTGSIDSGYILGVGDEVVVTLRGQKNTTLRNRVDREGRVVLPELAPVAAAGRQFGAFREELEAIVSSTFVQTEVFVSVGSVRSAAVYVVGEVERPGVQRLNGLSSLLDAIVAAGGIRKTGSLRAVKLQRGAATRVIDLYDVVLNGRSGGSLAIADGDRLVVPPLTSTFAVAGEVRRPGIFELPGASSSIAVKDALELAGGRLRPDGYRYLRIGAGSDGRETVQELDPSNENIRIRNGDVLLLNRARNNEIGGFQLEGHVVAPGVRSLQAQPTVSSVLADKTVFKENPYLLFGALQTTDDQTLARYYVPIDLTHVISGQADVRLKRNDRLIVFGMGDILYLTSAEVQAVLARQPLPNRGPGAADNPKVEPLAAAQSGDEIVAGSKKPRTSEPCQGLKVLTALMDSARPERFANAMQAMRQDNMAKNTMSCPPIFDRYPDLLPFALDYAVSLQGEVRQPGAFPILPKTSLQSVIAISSGLGREADLSQIEITRFAEPQDRVSGTSLRVNVDARSANIRQVVLEPGDIIRFNPLFSARDVGPVVLGGEVKRPGIYNIYRGEKLSEVIARAGGLTEEAYALGSVFTRARVRKQEAEMRDRLISQFESSIRRAVLVAAQNPGGEKATPVLSQGQDLLNKIRATQPSGRVVMESDPAVLQVRPELDTVVEPGDELYIPKRPNHIAIVGEVLNPSAQQFDPSADAASYIEYAGGLTQAADADRIFAVLPNGQARPLSVSSWNMQVVHLPPGSTIVVPVDAMPFSTWGITRDIMDIVSKFALSAASIAVISK